MVAKKGLISIEKSLLVHLMNDHSLIAEADGVIKSDYFSAEAYGAVFEVISSFYTQNKEITKLTIIKHLEDYVKEYANDGRDAIIRLYKPATSFKECLNIVREEGLKREMRQSFIDAIESIDNNNIEKATDIVNRSVSSYISGDKNTLFNASELADDIYNDYIDTLDNGYKPKGVEIPYKSLDLILGNLVHGRLTLVSARTGGGKTSFVVNLINNLSIERNYKTLYFSLEMSNKDIAESFMATTGGYSKRRAEKGLVPKAKIETGRDKLLKSQKNLFIDERRASLSYIRRRIKQIKMKSELDIVVIDHAGLISEKSDNIYQSSDTIWNDLKAIAKEFNVHVIGLQQYNRSTYDKSTKTPNLSWLKGGSSIEQACDACILMDYSSNQLDPIRDENGYYDLTLYVIKNRHGEKRNLKFKWDASINDFRDIDLLGQKFSRSGARLQPLPEDSQLEIKNIFEEKGE